MSVHAWKQTKPFTVCEPTRDLSIGQPSCVGLGTANDAVIRSPQPIDVDLTHYVAFVQVSAEESEFILTPGWDITVHKPHPKPFEGEDPPPRCAKATQSRVVG